MIFAFFIGLPFGVTTRPESETVVIFEVVDSVRAGEAVRSVRTGWTFRDLFPGISIAKAEFGKEIIAVTSRQASVNNLRAVILFLKLNYRDEFAASKPKGAIATFLLNV